METVKENNTLQTFDTPRIEQAREKLTPAHKVRAPAKSGIPTRERNRVIQHAAVKPLTVMMEVLAERYKLAQAIQDDPEARTKAMNEAIAVAKEVAPYLHPKLQATTIKGDADNPLTFAVALPEATLLMAAVRGKIAK
jgi:hypothetical protein